MNVQCNVQNNFIGNEPMKLRCDTESSRTRIRTGAAWRLWVLLIYSAAADLVGHCRAMRRFRARWIQ